MHWTTRRLCSVHHPSAAGCSKYLTFCTFEIWEIWHFCVKLKVSNIATNFVVKRCKYKYWIAFCCVFTGHMNCIGKNSKLSCTAYAVHLICSSFRCNSYGPWTQTKFDSMLPWIDEDDINNESKTTSYMHHDVCIQAQWYHPELKINKWDHHWKITMTITPSLSF